MTGAYDPYDSLRRRVQQRIAQNVSQIDAASAGQAPAGPFPSPRRRPRPGPMQGEAPPSANPGRRQEGGMTVGEFVRILTDPPQDRRTTTAGR